MTKPDWNAFCAATTDAIREAACERMYGTAQPAPPNLDMVDLCCSIAAIRHDAAYLERIFDDAEDLDAQRGSTLRAHRDDLRHMLAALALLVAEAEAA